MAEKIPLSVVVIAKNEQDHIADCLRSVEWADDIVLLDNYSADRTPEIAREFTDRVILRKMEVEGTHRNYGYSLAKNKWVLSLDADEVVTPELKDEISEIVASKTEFAGFSIPIRTFYGDYWVRYGGWYPASKLRLFQRDKFRYEEVGVHPRAFLDGEWGSLKGDIIHRGYPNIAHFLEGFNRQTTLEAQKWFDEKRKIGLCKALRKTFDRFFKSYVLKKGHKDGFVGFVFSFFSGFYQFVSYAKYWEMLWLNQKSLPAGRKNEIYILR